MANELCPYCHTDRDGYTVHLPKVGIGQALIYKHPNIFGGWLLHVRGLYRSEMKIQIKFCPMCGRKLKEAEDDAEY